MNENLDYLINEQEAPADKAQGERLSPEEYAAKKDAERNEVYAMADETAQAVASSGEKFGQYLATLSKFELYSPTNTLLIFAQSPDATRLRDYDKWRESGNPVKRGEHGIKILEREDYEKDGKKGYNFNIKKLFDIRQTNAKQPEAARSYDIKNLVKALMKTTHCKIVLVDELSGDAKGTAGAQYLPGETDRIEVTKGLDGNSLFCCLSQEIALASLAQIDPDKLPCKDINFTAYAASYTLCKKYGVDTKTFDFTDTPEYFADIAEDKVKGEIGAIRDTVADMAGAISKTLEQQKAAKNQEAR